MKRFITGSIAGAVGLLCVLVLVGHIQTTGFEGVDDTVAVNRMPLWEKAAKFYLRHVEFERWAKEAAGGETDPQRRVLKLMDWTMENVHHIQPGLPFIDDHISHIVLRHYGSRGQLAEVFTALATYTGNESRWFWYKPTVASERLYISFVKSERGWMVFDVWNGIWFETPSGRIATIADFRHPEQLRRRGQAPEVLNGTPYLDYFQDLDQVRERSFSRARGQMPWHRLLMLLNLEQEDSD